METCQDLRGVPHLLIVEQVNDLSLEHLWLLLLVTKSPTHVLECSFLIALVLCRLLREQTKLVRSWASAAAKLLGSTSTHPAKRPCELPATLRGGGYQRGIFTGRVLLPADMGLVISTQGSCASGKSGALHVTWPQPNSEMAVQALRKYQVQCVGLYLGGKVVS